MENLRAVVELHKNVGLKLNVAKCNVFQEEVEYLGHRVGKHGIQMVDHFIPRIKKWPISTTGGELRSFLGFVNYYRGFITNFTELTASLNKLRSTPGKIVLTDAQKECINKLKREFEGPHLRVYPDFESGNPFILETDWSAIGIGAILKQKQGEKERFIACASRTNNKYESNYPAHKGELSTRVYGYKKFEHILTCRPFISRTDSTFLRQPTIAEVLSGIFLRWITYLSRFDMLVEYQKGSLNQADGLSRINWPAGLAEDREELTGDGLDGTVHQLDNQVLHLKPKKDLILGQLTDVNLQRIKSLLLKQANISQIKQQEGNDTICQYYRVFDKLTIINDLVCYVDGCIKDDKPVIRICIPSKLIGRILSVAHLGHPGMNETYQRSKSKFYWPNQKCHSDQFVASCNVCAGKTNFVKCPRSFYNEIVGRPNLLVTIDFVGPLNAGILRESGSVIFVL